MGGLSICFFFNDTATTEIYTLSLHDALPISTLGLWRRDAEGGCMAERLVGRGPYRQTGPEPVGEGSETGRAAPERSEEHTSELQSRQYLVCRLLLEKKKQ